jgi:hypothetical protein
MAKNKAGLLVFALLLSVLMIRPVSAHAAGSVDLTTSPLPISLTAQPSTTVSTDIRIKNNSESQTIKVSLMKFSAYGDTGKPALKDREPGDDYFDWVSFSPAVFVAPTGQWQTIKMTINIPKDGAFGYYYAVVFTPANAKPTGKGNVLLGSTAVLVLLDVQNPHAKRSLQIVSFSADKKIYEFLPARFNLKLHNNGNVHIQPHGNIFIKRGNSQIASLVVNTQEGNVLPASNRIFSVPWSDGFPVYTDKVQNGKTVLTKDGQPASQLKWDWSKFSKLRFGRYTAHLTAVYDNGKHVPLEASVSFWVIPWRVIGGLIIIFGLAVVGLWTSVVRPIVRRVRKRRDNDK